MSLMETILLSAGVALVVGLGRYVPLLVADVWRSWRAGPPRPSLELVEEYAAAHIAGINAGLWSGR